MNPRGFLYYFCLEWLNFNDPDNTYDPSSEAFVIKFKIIVFFVSTKWNNPDLVVKSFIVDKKYQNYSLEDFAQDVDFINWVNKGANKMEWEKFVLENPQLSNEINGAKRIVASLRFSTEGINRLFTEEEQALYKNIASFYKLNHKKRRSFRIRNLIRYAAVFVFALSIGAAINILYFSKSTPAFKEIAKSASNLREAKLILPDGEEIVLKEKETDLQFNSADIKIDHDSIINYNKKADPDALVQVVIPYGKRSNISLSDGTKICLNAGSKLIFPQKFSGRNRKVFLKGEAYFDVFKNKEVPFIVSTEDMDITVHGTRFNLREKDPEHELEVVLVEGAVGLTENSAMNILSKEIKLIPNQRAVYDKVAKKTFVESNVEVACYISWKDGLLEFNRESILNVFERLSQFYNVSFVTESRVELNRKISGKLDLEKSLEDVMKVVSDAAPITFSIEGGKVFVKSRN